MVGLKLWSGKTSKDQFSSPKDIQVVGKHPSTAINTNNPSDNEDKPQLDHPLENGESRNSDNNLQVTPVSSKHMSEEGNDVQPSPATIPDQTPVLTEDDEKFLEQVTSEMEMPPPLPPRRATVIGDDGEVTEKTEEEALELAKDLPLPAPPPGEKEQLQAKSTVNVPSLTWKERWNQMSYVPASAANLYFTTPNIWPIKNKTQPDPKASTSESTTASAPEATTTNTTTEKSSKDLSHLLSTLNLSTLNNRAIGISHDTQKLLESFTLILKDVLTGAPTAYHDLEHLLKTRESQLDKLFGELPPFLQTLVRSMPVKMYAVLAPQLAAAIPLTGDKSVSLTAAEASAGEEGSKAKTGEKKPAEKKTSLIPTVKNLIAQKGAVAAMLRSIMTFMEMRFPLFLTGTNVAMSLSVFVLLFIFYYCHKRGKEARLLNAIELPVDPSLDTLEHAITLEQSEIIQERKKHAFDTEKAVEVPVGDDGEP